MYRAIVLILTLLISTTVVFAQKLPPKPTVAERAELEATWQTLAPNDEECVGTNLLTNASFEGEYSSYTPTPPHPDCQWGVCASAQMASGWTPYWRSHNPADPEWIYRMPEWKPAESWHTNPVRVRSGDRAQQWFTFYGTHQAGIFQQVHNVTPGAELCLSIWGHAWSTNSDHTYTDPNDHGFLNQQIGIDPTGGTNYLSPNVIWTSPVTQYDEYGLFRLEAIAQSDTVTVFFHSEPLWAYKHNDVYWDDAILTATVSEPATMSADPLWFGLDATVDTPLTQTETVNVTLENAGQMGWSARVIPNGSFTPLLRESADALHIDVDSAGLGIGDHRATVEIAADDPTISGGRQYVTVDLTIMPSSPTVIATPADFTFMVEMGETRTASTQIEITDSDDLMWTATISPTARGQEFPIIFESNTGTDGDTLTFTTFSAPLTTSGTYMTTILVEATGTTRAEIPVTLVVVEQRFDVYLPIVRR